MKKKTRILSTALAVIMLFSLATPCFAAYEERAGSGEASAGAAAAEEPRLDGTSGPEKDAPAPSEENASEDASAEDTDYPTGGVLEMRLRTP